MNTENNLKPYGVIYRITNNINGKIYIGQTKASIGERLKQHIYEKRAKMPICFAIQKYGKNNFKIEEIDIGFSKEELDYIEEYWIKFYNTTNRKIGYNVLCGSVSRLVTKEQTIKRAKFFIKCLETDEVFISIRDAAKSKNISRGNLSNCVNKRRSYNTLGGFHWMKIKKEELLNTDLLIKNIVEQKHKNPRKVERTAHNSIICLETNEIFYSVFSLADFFGLKNYTYLYKRLKKDGRFRGKTYKYIK